MTLFGIFQTPLSFGDTGMATHPPWRYIFIIQKNYLKLDFFLTKRDSIWFKILEEMSRDTMANPFSPLCDIWWHFPGPYPLKKECHVLFEWSFTSSRKLYSNPNISLSQWFSTFLSLRHTNFRRMFGGKYKGKKRDQKRWKYDCFCILSSIF